MVTEQEITTTTTTTIEEKYKVLAPESMQETFMSDSEDEGGKNFYFGYKFSHFYLFLFFFLNSLVQLHIRRNLDMLLALLDNFLVRKLLQLFLYQSLDLSQIKS